MSKYNDIMFDDVRSHIREKFEVYKSKENVQVLEVDNEEERATVLKYLSKTHNWNVEINIFDWNELVEREWESYVETIPFDNKDGVVFSATEENQFEITNNKFKTWPKFKNNSLKKINKFNEQTINNIESDVHKIIRNLSLDTREVEPIKGLVIGGVQSGKTTNMAGIMAMGADFGFNVFIVLSGMIESLREQTEQRISKLLSNTNGDRVWEKIVPQNYQNNFLSSVYRPDKNLYMVVLKNKTRLENLLDWLQGDKNVAENLKVLIIDDESDQASTNTSKDPENDRKTINRLIVNLVHNKDKTNKYNDFSFRSINYVGYTATPYANILSESPDNLESLYPQNFIATLTESPQHFGPREIFGYLDEERSEPLNIVNFIKDKDEITQLLLGEKKELPKSLKEAIAYFISASASLRKHNFNQPVSMLVHVSNRILHHDMLLEAICEWLQNNKNEVKEIAEEVWEKSLEEINFSDFNKKIKLDPYKSLTPHNFDQIKEEIDQILATIRPISKDEKEIYEYHDGIHTIAEHSGISRNDTHEYRLRYPEDEKDKEKTPVFLVVGGATLSRGITLEGLISTYFLRTPSSADTLTQMGRWFGYRINYELYPRIWMTNKTFEQFRFIATLEEELREEIDSMSSLGINFKEVGPKIISMPQYIDVTSKNKSLAMVLNEYDFSGYNTQTYIFDNNTELQMKNVELTETFIDSLGDPVITERNNSSNIFWEKIKFDTIKNNLLSKFSFNKKIKSLNNIDSLIKWLEKASKEDLIDDWNVIIGGLGKANEDGNDWELKHFSTSMVKRTRLKKFEYDDINIGVLRNPRDLYKDIDFNLATNEEMTKIIENSNEMGKQKNYFKIRKELGMERIPQLIIYKISKNSIPNNDKREPLGIDSNLIGIYITIPGQSNDNKRHIITVEINNKPSLLEEYDNNLSEEN